MTNEPDNEIQVGDKLTPPRFKLDTVVGICALVFSAVIYSITLTFEEAPAVLAQNVQPATFPRLVIGIIALLGVIVIFQSRGRKSKVNDPIPRMTLISAIVMIAFVIAFQFFGIVLSMVMLCFFLPLIWGERNWLGLISFAVAFPAAVYGLFVLILKVHFEPGILGF